MTQCLLDQPAAQAWPSTHEWITEFLSAEGDHWDREAAVAMTSEALFSALIYADRPVRLAARRDGQTAQVSVYAHTSTLPKTEWTAGSPLVEDLLPRLRQRTRRCGAKAQITLDGAQTTIWFALPRKARGIGRLLTTSRQARGLAASVQVAAPHHQGLVPADPWSGTAAPIVVATLPAALADDRSD